MIKKILFLFVVVLLVQGCAKTFPENSLVSSKTKSPPVMDGVVDDIWDKAQSLTVDVEVPPYSEFDESYYGRKYKVFLKSLYTKEDVYFLYQWRGDERISYERQTWYFNQDKLIWMQKPKKNSDEYSGPVYEDKFAVIWNIGNSIANFNEVGCLVLCHGEYKHTNTEDEKGDVWHWKLDRTGPVNQLDDKWLTFSDKNGRKSDEGSGAYKTNSQELEDPNGNKVKVPLYWIPGKQDYHWIMKGDNSAKKIVEVNVDLDLIDQDGTVIPRNTKIPSLYGITPATGSRGDVAVYHNFEDGLWTLEVKRKLSTGNDDDIDFSDKKQMYYFSVAVFNEAAIAHAYSGASGTSFPLVFK
ncbi:MAG: ethylbenzene dehydrogenase-related protein [Spirochaetaceae bacterium]